MIKRACRLEVENPISEKNGELTDEDRVRQAEQVKEQAAYDAFQYVLENDPAGPRRLNGILELMILEGRCSVPDSHDADLVNSVLHTTNKGNIVFGASERGWGEIFGDLSHTLVRRQFMQLETTVIRRELDDQPAIEGVDERLEELAEIRVLLGLRALVGDYLDETFKVRGKDGMLTLPVLEGLEARLETHRDRVDELAMAS